VSDTGCDIHHGVAPGFSGQAVVDFLWLAEGPPQERLGSATIFCLGDQQISHNFRLRGLGYGAGCSVTLVRDLRQTVR
jgi:hypothetical protein